MGNTSCSAKSSKAWTLSKKSKPPALKMESQKIKSPLRRLVPLPFDWFYMSWLCFFLSMEVLSQKWLFPEQGSRLVGSLICIATRNLSIITAFWLGSFGPIFKNRLDIASVICPSSDASVFDPSCNYTPTEWKDRYILRSKVRSTSSVNWHNIPHEQSAVAV